MALEGIEAISTEYSDLMDLFFIIVLAMPLCFGCF